ncbi:MAG: hypothetical protein LJD31_02270 [Wolbachia endosymbiont of Menacanthus eurysternus]|nr:hypothetical protein [Wolbachia endosymbiont of Menacanthus eurysternus]
MTQTKNQNSPWKLENFCPITKMGIEGTVAVASLAAAITTIFVATGAIAGPAFLASVANPVGIAALFVAAVYFAVAAYTSYQQLYKNEEISGADITGQANKAVSDAVTSADITGKVKAAVDEKAKGFATKDELSAVEGRLGEKLGAGELKDNIVNLFTSPDGILADAKVTEALGAKFQTR